MPGGFYIRTDAGDVSMRAATVGDGKALRRVSMTACMGGAVALSGWPHPVVVALTGLALGKKSRPILMNHDTAQIVGHTDAVGVCRTFNASALQGLAAGNVADRTATATEETAKNTKRLVQAAQTGGLTFA